MVLLSNAEVGRPFAMDQDFIDLDLIFLARTTQCAVYDVARINFGALSAW